MERHPVCEAFFQLTGSCRYLLNGKSIELQPRSFCFIRPWVPHQFGFQPDPRRECEQMWFHFASEQCSCGIIRSKHDGSYLVETHFPLPAAYYPAYHHLTSVADPASAKIRRFFELILLETADSAEKKAPADTRDMDLAGAVKSFIRSRNGVNCSLDELEHAFGYSRSHLSHVFRRCAGMSIGECIDLVRIDCMREQRAHGMKQKEIAAELGFASASAFWLWRERLRRKGVQI